MRSSSLCLVLVVLSVLSQLCLAQNCNSLFFTPNGSSTAPGSSTGASTSGSTSFIFLDSISIISNTTAFGISLYPITPSSDPTTTLSITAGIYSGNISNPTLIAQAIPLSAQGSFPTNQLTLTPLIMLFSTPLSLSAGSYFIAYWYSWYGGIANSDLTFALTGTVNTTTTLYYTSGVNYTFGAALPANINTSTSGGSLQPGQLSAIVGPKTICPASSGASWPSSSSTGFNAASAMALPSASVLAMLLAAAVISMLTM